MGRGLYAEFAGPEELSRAWAELRSTGLSRMETYTPYEVARGAAEAVAEEEAEDGTDGGEVGNDRERSWLPRITFAAGLSAAVAAYWVQWYTNVVDYPLNAGGRPPHAPPAFFYVTFEMMALAAGLTVLVGLFVSLRLPALWHPVFEIEGFDRASSDRHWIAVAADDPVFEEEGVRRLLEGLGALRVAEGEVATG